MAVPDYVYFEPGNPLTESYAGQWFQTLDLFGYFEKYRVHADGTIWLTPTKHIPSPQLTDGMGGTTMKKVDLPPVQILVCACVSVTGDEAMLDLEFREGKLAGIRNTFRSLPKAVTHETHVE